MNLKEVLGESYSEDMSKEDLLEALAKLEMPVDKSAEVETKYKNLLSKANSEVADYKRQLKDKMSEEEIKAKEAEDAQNKLKSDYEALLAKVTISEHTAKFLSLGFDEESAGKAATALVDGKTDALFELIKGNNDSIIARYKAESIDGMPKPSGGQGSKTLTKDEFLKLTPQERLSFSNEHPEEYRALYES